MISEGRTSKNVCVIGAGPSGLVAARELRKEGHGVVVLEQNHDIGGQWLYHPNVEDQDPLGKCPILKVHSSIYASLRVISPRETMGFMDFPFRVREGRDSRRFPGHKEVLMYLRDFCEWFGLQDMIRFNTRVDYVGMLNHEECNDDGLKWTVKSIKKKKAGYDDDDQKVVVEELFDAVVVATGHYSQPRLPTIKGMEAWKRKQIHSHVYRVPEPFRNEVVVVVGNSYSGQDISIELVPVAKDVHLSVKDLKIAEGLAKIISKHCNFYLHPQIESLQEDGRVAFVDGSLIFADSIIYCTGYSYSFPFLDTKGIVSVDDNRVGPLYEHTFPPKLAPSLSFVGIPRKIIGFPFFESQAKWVAQLLSGKRKLPSQEEMTKSIKDFYNSRDVAGIPKHYTHEIGEFEYCDRYADYMEFPHLEEWRKVLCRSAVKNSYANLETYRDSYSDDYEMLQVAHQTPHFTQLGDHAIPL
ncbi:flavin-containing monooxygenase FMO GS-OX-like 8 [Coffea arabica]|uniref:Flavin-containing monooxygenase n=1 Tax=Coffea arabica TaxID=13443 RepID=A0A6P6X9A7_COFAR|nr:flavin-containing monooxygenase FMO GS-OX-like 8 [Coffea arabica]